MCLNYQNFPHYYFQISAPIAPISQAQIKEKISGICWVFCFGSLKPGGQSITILGLLTGCREGRGRRRQRESSIGQRCSKILSIVMTQWTQLPRDLVIPCPTQQEYPHLYTPPCPGLFLPTPPYPGLCHPIPPYPTLKTGYHPSLVRWQGTRLLTFSPPLVIGADSRVTRINIKTQDSLNKQTSTQA